MYITHFSTKTVQILKCDNVNSTFRPSTLQPKLHGVMHAAISNLNRILSILLLL